MNEHRIPIGASLRAAAIRRAHELRREAIERAWDGIASGVTHAVRRFLHACNLRVLEA